MPPCLLYEQVEGRGLLMANTAHTPMQQIGEHGSRIVNGSGCSGVQEGAECWSVSVGCRVRLITLPSNKGGEPVDWLQLYQGLDLDICI